MPRDVTALGGLESVEQQITVTLIRLEIPSNDIRIHTADVPLYLNPSTNAGAMVPGVGKLLFSPGKGLKLPDYEFTDDLPLGDVSFDISNATGTWWAISAANAYRLAPATVWRANLVIAAGDPPFSATFQGAVQVWSGDLAHINNGRRVSTVTLTAPNPFDMIIPRETYTQQDFPHMPTPGSKMTWGLTERTR